MLSNSGLVGPREKEGPVDIRIMSARIRLCEGGDEVRLTGEDNPRLTVRSSDRPQTRIVSKDEVVAIRHARTVGSENGSRPRWPRLIVHERGMRVDAFREERLVGRRVARSNMMGID